MLIIMIVSLSDWLSNGCLCCWSYGRIRQSNRYTCGNVQNPATLYVCILHSDEPQRLGALGALTCALIGRLGKGPVHRWPSLHTFRWSNIDCQLLHTKLLKQITCSTVITTDSAIHSTPETTSSCYRKLNEITYQKYGYASKWLVMFEHWSKSCV